MNILINLIGIALIILTYWFFLTKKESEAIEVKDTVTIVVEGGYKPNIIKIKKGKSVSLKFYRKDESSCLEEVTIPDFGIRQYLKLNETTEIVIIPEKIGKYNFSCGMNMFHGKIVVTE